MNEVELYKQIERAKKALNILLDDNKFRIVYYKTAKRDLKAVIENAKRNPESALCVQMNDYCLREYNSFNRDEFNNVVLTKLEALNFTPDPLKSQDYLLGVISKAASDLLIMKETRNMNASKATLDYQQEMSERHFTRAAGTTGDRYSYKPYFPTLENGGTGVWKGDGNYSAWNVPIRRTWYKRVYLQGLAVTDIAGKAVMVTDVSEVNPREFENDLEDFEKGKIKVFKAKVAYAKNVTRGKIQRSSWMFDTLDAHCTSMNVEEFRQQNPNWEADHAHLGMSISPFKDARLPATRSHLRPDNPEICVLLRHKGKVRERIYYNDYKQATLGFLEERFIASFKTPEMSEPKIASGTTMLRSISVLRNRISKDVAKKMGVI